MEIKNWEFDDRKKEPKLLIYEGIFIFSSKFKTSFDLDYNLFKYDRKKG